VSLRSRLSDPAARPRLWRQAVLIVTALLVFVIGYRILLPPAVPVLSIRSGPLVQTVVATGRVRADTRARLGASITGTTTRVLVREGDTVRAGQLLAELDSRELAAAVAQARASLQQLKEVRRPVTAASLRQAEAVYQKAEADFRRAETLLKGGATSEDQYEQSRQLLETARSQRDIARAQAAATATTGADVMAAEAALASAEARLAYTRITAPADGVVLTRNLEPGDAVQPGRTLLELALRARTMLSVVPDEKNLARLAVGQPAQASADAFPESRFRARVAYVSPVVDPAQGTVEVRLSVDSVPAYLRPDMTVSVDIEVARLDSAVVIPLEAVREPLSPRPWTLVIRDRHVARQQLTLGIRGNELAQVLDGVKTGELVVPLRARGVAVGERVRARRE
jgi:HlyD family secretion protein